MGHGHASDDLKQSLLAGAGHPAPPHGAAKGAADVNVSVAVEQSRSQSRKISLLDAVLAPTAAAYASTGAPRGEGRGAPYGSGASSTYRSYGSEAAGLGSLSSVVLEPRAELALPSWGDFSPHCRLATMAGVCNRARYESEVVEVVLIGDEPQSPEQSPELLHAAAAGGERGATRDSWFGPGPAQEGVDPRRKERRILGDASDAGLLRFTDALYPVLAARALLPSLYEIPFNSVSKWSLCVVADPARPMQSHVVMIKGAPEVILTL